MNDAAERWERFLDPDFLRPSLFAATMFITTFEILKDSIVDRIRSFYINGLDENGPIVGPEYHTEVLARNRSVVYASLDWLRENEVIDDKDLDTFEQLKGIRNQLAHRLFAIVTGQIESAHEGQFETLVALLRKIEVWWLSISRFRSIQTSTAERSMRKASCRCDPISANADSSGIGQHRAS
jgi:hypothetical protein